MFVWLQWNNVFVKGKFVAGQHRVLLVSMDLKQQLVILQRINAVMFNTAGNPIEYEEVLVMSRRQHRDGVIYTLLYRNSEGR